MEPEKMNIIRTALSGSTEPIMLSAKMGIWLKAMEGSGRTRTARSSEYTDMDEKEKATIPYFVHEGEMARMDRNNKRLLTALVTCSMRTGPGILFSGETLRIVLHDTR